MSDPLTGKQRQGGARVCGACLGICAPRTSPSYGRKGRDVDPSPLELEQINALGDEAERLNNALARRGMTHAQGLDILGIAAIALLRVLPPPEAEQMLRAWLSRVAKLGHIDDGSA